MKSFGVWAVPAALLLLITTVKGDEGGVSFWREDFTMTCPEEGEWNRENPHKNGTSKDLTLKYNDISKGLHHCTYKGVDNNSKDSEIIYSFYVKGQVCENCFELDGLVILGVIVADVLLTGCVSLLIYKWAKNKNSSKANPTTPAPHRAPGRSGPPVPSPDYEPLNAHTRSADMYSTVNRMG